MCRSVFAVLGSGGLDRRQSLRIAVGAGRFYSVLVLVSFFAFFVFKFWEDTQGRCPRSSAVLQVSVGCQPRTGMVIGVGFDLSTMREPSRASSTSLSIHTNPRLSVN